MPVQLAQLTDRPLDLDTHLRAVDDPRQGAVATFVGQVRDHDPEVRGEVVQLSYSAHPDAPAVLRDIAETVVAQHDPQNKTLVAISHRVGELAVGDLAIVAAVSSPHRALAFEVCAALVEEVKRSLPVWKQQHAADGDAVWSGLR